MVRSRRPLSSCVHGNWWPDRCSVDALSLERLRGILLTVLVSHIVDSSHLRFGVIRIINDIECHIDAHDLLEVDPILNSQLVKFLLLLQLWKSCDHLHYLCGGRCRLAVLGSDLSGNCFNFIFSV